jgi:acetyltransferase
MAGARVVVQPATRRPDALILMAGIASDPTFGRVLHLGAGGRQKRLDGRGALALPPLNMALAGAMIARTRIGDMAAQALDRADLDEVSLRWLLVRLSDMAVDLPELALLQINPLLADGDGVLALDAVAAVEPARDDRPTVAIRPYPAELEEELALRDGGTVQVRPVRAEDEPAYTALLQRTDPAGVPSRLGRVGLVPRDVALQLVHIDYDRQMTFVVSRLAADGSPELLGVVDTLTTPDNREAEYSLLVRRDVRRAGLGRALLEKMIRYCRGRGTRRVFAMVRKSDVPMLSLAFKLGFQPDLDGAWGDDVEKMVLRLN